MVSTGSHRGPEPDRGPTVTPRGDCAVRPADAPGSGLHLIRTAYRTADGGHVDVTAVGEVDLAEDPVPRCGLARYVSSPSPVVVDLAGCGSWAPAERLLIDAYKEAMRGAKGFHVVNVCGFPRRVLEILGV